MKLLKTSSALAVVMLLGAMTSAADADVVIVNDDAPAWVAGMADIADGSALAFQDAEDDEECDDEEDDEEDDECEDDEDELV